MNQGKKPQNTAGPEKKGMSRREMLKTGAALSAAVVTGGAGLSCSRETVALCDV